MIFMQFRCSNHRKNGEKLFFSTFSLFGPEIYPKRIIGISPKTNQQIAPSQGIKLPNLKRIRAAVLLLSQYSCNFSTILLLGPQIYPKKIIGISPKVYQRIAPSQGIKLPNLKKIRQAVLSLSQYSWIDTHGGSGGAEGFKKRTWILKAPHIYMWGLIRYKHKK